MEAGKVYLDERPNGGITIGNRLRNLDEKRVAQLADSIAAIGLQTPISVYSPNDQEVHLVAGAHRLAAAIKLGWDSIDCIYVSLSEIDRRRWEIAENLHRAELTVLQRDEHVSEWIRLTEKQEAEKLAQLAPVSTKGGRGKVAGVRAASRELGIDRDDARRAVKVASLSEEAKEVARSVHLDDNRSALLKAATQAEPAQQIETLRGIAAKKQEPKDEPEADDGDRWTYEQQLAYDALVDAWEAAPESARWDFLRWLPAKYAGSIAA